MCGQEMKKECLVSSKEISKKFPKISLPTKRDKKVCCAHVLVPRLVHTTWCVMYTHMSTRPTTR